MAAAARLSAASNNSQPSNSPAPGRSPRCAAPAFALPEDDPGAGPVEDQVEHIAADATVRVLVPDAPRQVRPSTASLPVAGYLRVRPP